MQKDTFLSVFRTLLTLIGSFVIGKVIWHGTLTEETWQIGVGAVLTLTGTIWGIADKSATIEAIESGIRSVVISIGGLLVAAGYITGKSLDAILGLVTALIPVLQSYAGKVKVHQIYAGDIKATSTGKAVKMVFFLLFVSCVVNGQSIFRHVPAPAFHAAKEMQIESFIPYGVSLQRDSTWTGVRPIVGVAAFSEPGNQLMTGAGVGYQKLRWDYSLDKWQSDYSVSVLVWAAGSVSPGPQVPAFGIGPAIGVFNNLLLIGGGYDFTHTRFFGALSFGISLN